MIQQAFVIYQWSCKTSPDIWTESFEETFPLYPLVVRSGEEFFKVFNIYGHDGNLGRVTRTIYINFCFPFLRMEAPHDIWL